MLLAVITYSFVIITTLIFFSNIDINNNTIHIILSVISYTLLFASFILSFVLNYQQKHLHSHNINKFILFLPALDKTEKVLFSNIYLSLILLGFAIISGFIYLEDIFAQHLAHKTFFAIFAWFLILTISVLRIFKGLRDKKATRTIQLAFLLIILGYFGSKFVLSII
jgi:ABC-type uncharacterized transport system permease subunit